MQVTSRLIVRPASLKLRPSVVASLVEAMREAVAAARSVDRKAAS